MSKKSEFARMLQAKRIEHNLTQRELAAASGVSEVTIRNYENSLRVPGYNDLMRLNDLLSLELKDFVREYPEYKNKILAELCFCFGITTEKLLRDCSHFNYQIDDVILRYLEARAAYNSQLPYGIIPTYVFPFYDKKKKPD